MRHALLEAAVDSLVELGFARTTTLEVQRRAGVSRGALLHHFPSKAELLVATIAHLAERRGRDLKQRSLSLPTGPARVDAVLDTAVGVLRRPDVPGRDRAARRRPHRP
jgi:AcrR family transcriptional regulator